MASETHELRDNKWVPSRPINCDTFWDKLRAARLVLIGKADAVIWKFDDVYSKKYLRYNNLSNDDDVVRS